MGNTIMRKLTLASGVAALALMTCAFPAAAQQRAFDIPAVDAVSAMRLFALQTGQPYIEPPAGARRITVNPVKGDFTPEEALARMLAGTDLAATQQTTVVLQLVPKPTAATPPAEAQNVSGILSSAAKDDASRLLSGEGLPRWGTLNAEEALNALPQFVGDKTAFSNSDGDGTATANLRGLGANRTLVLVNGRRYIPSGLSQTVDLNTIPTFLIEGVSSAGGVEAGTDGLAGAIDFRLRKVDGLEVGADYGLTGRGDGERFAAHLALGTDFAGGKGHLTAYGEYLDRSAISQGERAVSSVPLADQGGKLTPVISTSTPGGRFVIAPTITVPGARGVPTVVVNRAAGTTFGSSLGATFSAPGATSRNYSVDDGYNAAPDIYLQTPQTRWSIGAFGEYEVNPQITAYAELAYSGNTVTTQLAPTEITGRFRINTAANAKFFTAADNAAIAAIDANEELIRAAFVATGVRPDTTYTTNYYLPGAGVAILDIYRRLSEVGARTSEYDRRAVRAVLGVKGQLAPRWSYDAYFSYASTRDANTQQGGVSLTAFTKAVELATINIYGPGSLTPEMVRSIAVVLQNNEQSDLSVAHASTQGELFNLGLGAKDATVTVGGEYRRNSGRYTPDALLLTGDVVGFSAATAANGHYDVREVFGQLEVPIAAGRPFIDLLQVDGGLRYSDYSLDAVGSTYTYDLGGFWAPNQQIGFVARYERGTRAPSLGELYGFNGNAYLKAETSKSLILGAVFTPSAAPGLSTSLSHFSIDVSDMILQSQIAATPNSNLASQKTSGWDLRADYSRPLAFGAFSDRSLLQVSVTGAYTDKNELRTGGASSSLIDLAGKFSSSTGTLQAKQKWVSTLAWQDGPLTTSLRWRHLGAVKDGDPSTTYAVEKIDAYNLYDLSVSYAFANQVRITAGINNLLDEPAPVLGSNQDQGNTYPSAYDVRGRDVFISTKARF
ncbi:TonB-dependent receptor [Caulobacter sp. 602-2]|uniref:TonB-dependent receptor n=1 Tax=Caulobacter sp. 602-2 TaxID=2710887 RepID=A0A6G4QZB3_9CAUL|nr:TonB-dependent receptor [Caulobacter sp. 602-2]NGM50881.1 TonB-dependent receptor [Caulobacter sp. 602-2]